MTGPPAGTPAACLEILERARAGPGGPGPDELAVLAEAPPAALDGALRDFAAAHGAGALGVLTGLAGGADRALRRAAKRALYRLSQRGVAPPPPPPRPVVERRRERPSRAWISGVDGTGSRAVWVFFEDGLGGSGLCSLLVNDTVGIVEVAGGEVSRKRLEAELAALRASQKLPWVETEPRRALAAVNEALARHRELGTQPPAGFARWQPLFSGGPVAEPPALTPDDALAERAAELFELPELAGWFLDPDAVSSDALELEETRQSRLVVSEQVKREREETIVTRVVEREVASPEARRRWARRLAEMAYIFQATGRPEPARVAEAAAHALADLERPVARQAFAQHLARRALEVAAEVAAGRVSAADVSRKPAPVTAAGRGLA